jgi:hypothetical protein
MRLIIPRKRGLMKSSPNLRICIRNFMWLIPLANREISQLAMSFVKGKEILRILELTLFIKTTRKIIYRSIQKPPT